LSYSPRRHGDTEKALDEALSFGEKVDTIRALIERWLEGFLESNGYLPSRIWVKGYPEEWDTGEIHIGCHIAGREIKFPMTHVFPKASSVSL
jgi:hypothetical protein